MTGPNYHYLGLPGANTLLTNASQETYANLVTNLNAHNGTGGMMCVHGGVGLGKTFAVNLHLDELAPHTTVRLKLSSPSLQKLRESLHHRLNIPGPPPGNRTRCENAITAALTEDQHVLVIDEAQWLDTRAFEFIRELWDDQDTRLAVIFVGAESCYQKIKNRPALDSRILLWQRYTPLTPNEVLATMPRYHSLWNDVPADDLLWIDDLACHGNFRQWAKVTYLLQEATTNQPHVTYSKDLIRAVFSRLDPTTRHAS